MAYFHELTLILMILALKSPIVLNKEFLFKKLLSFNIRFQY